jgi:microcystin degradation protein MlrC
MTQPIRIAVLNFAHETVTFLPNDTTLDDFVYQGSPARARRCSPGSRAPTWVAS